MKAAMMIDVNKVEAVDDLPEPEFTEGVLVKVKMTGFCATDVKIIRGFKKPYRPLPMIFGHEFAGEVVKSTVEKYKPGDRISVAPFCGCGHCKFCLGGEEQLCKEKSHFSSGTTASLVTIGSNLALKAGWKIPEDVTWEEAAMSEPLACVILSMRSVNFQPGESVLILGAGFMGMLHVLLAKAWGASRVMVSEPTEVRRELARKLGADVINPEDGQDVGEWARSLCGEGPDIIIAAAGFKGVADAAIAAAGSGSRIHLFGGMPTGTIVEVPADLIHYKRVSMHGTSGFRSIDVQTAAEMIKGHAIDLMPLATYKFSVDEAQEAFEATLKPESQRVFLENPEF
jgi:L-iditol 2-dehydrogenase